MAFRRVNETPAQVWERLGAEISEGHVFRGRMIHRLGVRAVREASAERRDFVILDAEKGRPQGRCDGLEPSDIAACLVEAREHELMVMVRVAADGIESLSEVIEGVDAIMISEVTSPSDLPDRIDHPLVAILESASLLNDIPHLVASRKIAAFCVGPHDLAASLGKAGNVSDPLVIRTIDTAIKQLVSDGQIIIVPERVGFDLAGWRDAGVGMFVERQSVLGE